MLFCIHVAASVFCSRQAIVMGPTPPGTGVSAPATDFTFSKSTSPTSFDFPAESGGNLLIPTSMTVAPFFTQFFLTILYIAL